jgi:hypothetical protein
MEVRLRGGEFLKFLLVVDVLRIAGSVDEPDAAFALTMLAAAIQSEELLNHTAEGRHAGAGSDKDHVFHLRFKHEESMWPVEARRFVNLPITEEVRHESFINAVKTQVKGVVSAGRRRDGIGSRNELIAARFPYREELARDKIEGRNLLDDKLKMLGFLREQHGAGKPGGEQGVFHFLPRRREYSLF